jgi:hypothetical protein
MLNSVVNDAFSVSLEGDFRRNQAEISDIDGGKETINLVHQEEIASR